MADFATKTGISAKDLREKLGHWEIKGDPKAPLNERQKNSFMELATFAANRPLPIEVKVVRYCVVCVSISGCIIRQLCHEVKC